MSGRNKAIGGVALVAVAAAAAAAALMPRGGAANGVRGIEVVRGDLVDRALAVGTIVPEVEVSVKSKVSGVVQRRFAEVGDFVPAGAALLEIRPDPTPLELVEARRQLELNESQLESLARQYERQQELRARGLVAEQEYDQSRQRWTEAQLQAQVARDRLALLEQGRVATAGGRIESVVRSPISGYILEKRVEVGDPVVPLSSYQEGTVLLTMADMQSLIFRGTVDEIDVGRLAEGMEAEIRVGALPDARIRGVVSRISLKARREDQATTFPIEITLETPDGVTLRAGYSASADVIIERRTDVLTVPERVVTFEGGTARVTVLRADGTTEPRTIRTGLSDAITVEVLEGLAAGERVLEKTAGPRR
jgi:HlyD family secretion protein